MKRPRLSRRSVTLLAALLPLLIVFVHVVVRSGPLAPVAVVAGTVELRSINPALFGIGNVEARHVYRIGPTTAGRVKQLHVQVGDRVRAGQVLGEMEPVDLDDRLRVQEAMIQHADAAVREAGARQTYARAQATRYRSLLQIHAVSEEAAAAREQEQQIADAGVAAARQDLARARADNQAVLAQRESLRLLAPVDALVAARDAEPGTTVVAGQAVIELIDPQSLWINARFDQFSAAGLAAGLAAEIRLRSRRDDALAGTVIRVEPLADAVTEETLAKISFPAQSTPLPPLGELAEVSLSLPALPPSLVVPTAALRQVDGQIGVWLIEGKRLRFQAVRPGLHDLEGHAQVLDGLGTGQRILVFSEQAVTANSRIHVVERIAGVAR